MGYKHLRDEYGEALTINEIAALFRCDRKTVSRHPELFGGIKIGNLYRFFESKVAAVIEHGSIHVKKSISGSLKIRRTHRR